jgi:hypothetical protein
MFFSLSWTVICSQNVCCLLFFVLTVFTHRYGRDGRDTKKYEDSCLLFDYEFLQNLSSPQSVQHYKSCLATFIDLLNENATTGNHNRRNHLSWATFSNTQFFYARFQQFFHNIGCEIFYGGANAHSRSLSENSFVFWGTLHFCISFSTLNQNFSLSCTTLIISINLF